MATARASRSRRRRANSPTWKLSWRGRPLSGTLGIGHTRWATHGLPNDTNAHPHATEDGKIVIIHNGIIENYLKLKEELLGRGHEFKSETDSEVLAHLIEEAYSGDLYEAVRTALGQVRGAYGIVVTHVDHREIVAARTVSPLVMGVGDGEMFLASDVPALLAYTRKMVFLHDGDMVVLSDDGFRVTDLAGNEQTRASNTSTGTPRPPRKAGTTPTCSRKSMSSPSP